jgi:hypothetical protein
MPHPLIVAPPHRGTISAVSREDPSPSVTHEATGYLTPRR